MTQAEPLERERHVYESHLQEWLETHFGKFVLIRGDEVLGFYDGLELAFNDGTRRFGIEPFFVKQIMGDEAVNVSFFGQRLESV
jgi:hypothetical protein